MKQYKIINNNDFSKVICISDIVETIIEEHNKTDKEVVNEVFENLKSIIELSEENHVEPKSINYEIRFDLHDNKFKFF